MKTFGGSLGVVTFGHANVRKRERGVLESEEKVGKGEKYSDWGE